MQVSDKGRCFIRGHEGDVLKAYRCPAGVWTIGVGLTAGSGVIKPKPGMRITREESDRLFKLALDRKYEPPVRAYLPNVTQHAYDAANSMVWNCGPGSLKWKWAQALKAGNIPLAAARWRATAVTGGGKRLAGLVRRRKEEANLAEHGDYGRCGKASSSGATNEQTPVPEAPAISVGADRTEWENRIKALGFGSVEDFQKAKDLTVDDLVGPATRAAVIRAESARNGVNATGVSGATGAAGGAGTETASDPMVDAVDVLMSAGKWGIVLAGLVGGGYMVWRFRGPIFAKLPEGVKDFIQDKLGLTLGRRVPT